MEEKAPSFFFLQMPSDIGIFPWTLINLESIIVRIRIASFILILIYTEF